jgi:SOUL heme-binding protein
MKWKLAAAVALALAALAAAGCGAIRAGYESAPYTVVRRDRRFEIRDYPSLLVAETPAGADGKADDGAFMRLFRYISGRNTPETKISMTTPVLMSGESGHRTMAFVMPKSMTPAAAPAPADSLVHHREWPPSRCVVLRFKGVRKPERESAAADALAAYARTNGLATDGEPIFAYFDPPWTPGFLRRNEAMFRLASR